MPDTATRLASLQAGTAGDPCISIDSLRGSADAPPLSLEVLVGECVVLLGNRAQPLSETLDRLAGFLPNSGGRIRIDGRDITHQPAGSREIGIVSTRDPLFPHLDVRSNITFGLSARNRPPAECSARVNQTMALMGLDGLGDRLISEISPEYQVRVALARVVAIAPALLLLDDPLAGLGPDAWLVMGRLMSRLRRALSLTIIIAATRRDEALLLGDRIGLMDGSELLQLGKASELFDRPQDDRVAVAFGDANVLTGVIDAIEDDVARIYLPNGGVVEALASKGLRRDMVCVTCVRPDRIATILTTARRGAQQGGDEEGMIPATLTDATHLGDHVRLRFRLNDGTEVIVRRPPLQSMNGMEAGRTALLAWQPGHATAFPLRS